MTLVEFASTFVAFKAKRCKPATVAEYQRILKLRLLPASTLVIFVASQYLTQHCCTRNLPAIPAFRRIVPYRHSVEFSRSLACAD
jgi:hypothetical protein